MTVDHHFARKSAYDDGMQSSRRKRRRNGLPPRVKDITGQRFNSLVAESFAELQLRSDGLRHAIWRCKCDCGNTVNVPLNQLNRNTTKSCGCLSHYHGLTQTGAYSSWVGMRTRCDNPRTKSYPRYGGRGITYCERWNSFRNFYADMGDRPEGGTLDRIDANGDYEPGNCRWVTIQQQQRNRTTCRYARLNGERMLYADVAKALGLHPARIWKMARLGRPIPPGVDLVFE